MPINKYHLKQILQKKVIESLLVRRGEDEKESKVYN